MLKGKKLIKINILLSKINPNKDENLTSGKYLIFIIFIFLDMNSIKTIVEQIDKKEIIKEVKEKLMDIQTKTNEIYKNLGILISNYSDNESSSELKRCIKSCQSKLLLHRNEKIKETNEKKNEIITSLIQNNIDIAKIKMECLIRLEDIIAVYEILAYFCEDLIEKNLYLQDIKQIIPEIQAELDTIIYASYRIDIEELLQLRSLIQKRFGVAYIEAAYQNKVLLVNSQVIKLLKRKIIKDEYLIMRLKNFQEENKFPEKIVPNFYKEMRNQLGRLSNPYDPNPYGPGKINNLFGQSEGNNYSYVIGTKIGPWNDFNFYMKNSNLGGNIENRDNPYALSFSNSSRRVLMILEILFQIDPMNLVLITGL